MAVGVPVSVPGAGPVQNVTVPGPDVADGTGTGTVFDDDVVSQGTGMPVCFGFSLVSIQSILPVPSRPLLFEIACLVTPGGTGNVVSVKGE